MVRLEYSGKPYDTVVLEYRKIVRHAYKLLQGTWGWSALGPETIQIKNEHNHKFPPGPRHFEGMSDTQMIVSLFNPDWQSVHRGYVCFKDELDALQFRLTIEAKARQVFMWPSDTVFTIHEVVEDTA